MINQLSHFKDSELIKELEDRYLNKYQGGGSIYIPYKTNRCEIHSYGDGFHITSTYHGIGPLKVLLINNIIEPDDEQYKSCGNEPIHRSISIEEVE